MEYQRAPKIHLLKGSAIVSSTSWVVVDGNNTLPLAFSNAPGDAFSQGSVEAIHGEQLVLSQEQLNSITGHRYAKMNQRFGRFRITEPSGDIWDFEPALMGRIQLNISAERAAQRGLPFTQDNGMVLEMTLRYQTNKTGSWRSATLVWERESNGFPATTHIPDDPEEPDYENPPPVIPTDPIPFGPEEQNVAGIGSDGNLYRTFDFQTEDADGGPTWEKVSLGMGEVCSWVVDPFSPGYLNGEGTINGWAVGETDIYRIIDIFGATYTVSVHTFAEPIDLASGHWRSIQASFGAFFETGNPWILCVSYYGSTDGHLGTWSTNSVDGGSTWDAEVQISDLPLVTESTRVYPIGVYTSPRTPGLAYTVASAAPELSLEAGVVIGDHANHNTLTLNPGGVDENTYSVGYGSGRGGVTGSTEEDAIAGLEENTRTIYFGPPADTHKMTVRMVWSAIRRKGDGGGNSQSSSMDADGTGLTTTDDLNYSQPVFTLGPFDEDVANSFGVGEVSWEKTGLGDWPVTNDEMLASPTASVGGCNIQVYTGANSGSDSYSSIVITWKMWVSELIMDDGTIIVPEYEGQIGGFMSEDWGDTWEATDFIQPGDAFAGTIHLPWEGNLTETQGFFGHLTEEVTESAGELPTWGTWDIETDTYDVYTASSSRPLNLAANSPPGLDDNHVEINIFPPANTKRMTVTVEYFAERVRTGALLGFSSVTFLDNTHIDVTQTGALDFEPPGDNDEVFGFATLEYLHDNWATDDWPYNSDEIAASPPTTGVGTVGFRGRTRAQNAGGNTQSAVLLSSITVTEIELVDGTIYTPTDPVSGSTFATKRTASGVITDASPVVSDVTYGPNWGHFGIRAYDSNKDYMAMGGVGNSVSADPADDLHGVFVSSTGGITWSTIVTPIAASLVRYGFSAAFSGTDPDVLFIWGAYSDHDMAIAYTNDFGATVDSRVGNLHAAAGAQISLIGICGGPTGGV
jgi:hypothetical protein